MYQLICQGLLQQMSQANTPCPRECQYVSHNVKYFIYVFSSGKNIRDARSLFAYSERHAKKFMCNEKQYGHCYSYNSNANITLSFFFLLLLGYPFLHTTMALEKLGSRQNHCLNDGPRHRGRLRGGKEAKEKTLA